MEIKFRNCPHDSLLQNSMRNEGDSKVKPSYISGSFESIATTSASSEEIVDLRHIQFDDFAFSDDKEQLPNFPECNDEVKPALNVKLSRRLLQFLDQLVYNLGKGIDQVYNLCFESKYSGIGFAGIGLTIVLVLYFINPILVLPVATSLTVLYCCSVFHKRVYKKLIYQLLTDVKPINGKLKFNKRVKVTYLLAVLLFGTSCFMIPTIPVLPILATFTSLMKILSNCDYFGCYSKDQENITKQCLYKILLIAGVAIVILEVTSLLGSVFIFNISLSFIAKVAILAATTFINYYYRVAKNNATTPELAEAVARKNNYWKIGLIIFNGMLALFSFISAEIEKMYEYLVSIIKINDAASYFSIKQRKKKILMVSLTIAIFLPLIVWAPIMLSVLMIVGVCLLIRKKMYEAFNLDNKVDKSQKIEYNKPEQRLFFFIGNKKAIVWSLCISCFALGMLLLFTTTVSPWFFPVLILLMKFCDELYKKKQKNERFSLGCGSEIYAAGL